MRTARFFILSGAALVGAVTYLLTVDGDLGIRKAEGCAGIPAALYKPTTLEARFTHPVDGIPPWGALTVGMTVKSTLSSWGSYDTVVSYPITVTVQDASGATVPGAPSTYTLTAKSFAAGWETSFDPSKTEDKEFVWKASSPLPAGSYTLFLSGDIGAASLPFQVGDDLSDPTPSLQVAPAVKYDDTKAVVSCTFHEPGKCSGVKNVHKEMHPESIATATLKLTKDLSLSPTATHYFDTKVLVAVDGGPEEVWAPEVGFASGAKSACARLSVTHPKTQATFVSDVTCVDLTALDLSPQKRCDEALALINACRSGHNELAMNAQQVYDDVCGAKKLPPQPPGGGGSADAPSAGSEGSGCQVGVVGGGGAAAGLALALGALFVRRRRSRQARALRRSTTAAPGGASSSTWPGRSV